MGYQFRAITILVVEDSQPMLEIVRALLITFGVGEVLCAQNGKEGLELFNLHNPDIVIADWMMQPMDGITFSKNIRNDPNSPNPFVPIILMTGFSEKRRVLEARDSGVTEFLVKPFTARDLYKRIAQIIERPRQFVRSEDFFGPDRRRKKKNPVYAGPFRREVDYANPRILAMIREQKLREKEAHETLLRLRSEAGLGKGDAFDLNEKDLAGTKST